MNNTPLHLIGVDISPNRQPFTMAVMDQNKKLILLQRCKLDDLLAFFSTQPSFLTALNCPQSLNKGCMDSHPFRQSLNPIPHPARWQNLRVAEYFLAHNGVSIHRTPDRFSSATGWVKNGLQLYEQLRLTISSTLNPSGGGPRQHFESHAEAFFKAQIHGRLLDNRSLEGRLQRQLVLYELDLPVKDPMRFFEEVTRHRLLQGIMPADDLLPVSTLNAYAMVNMAWLLHNQPEKVARIGIEEEGWIYVPSAIKINATYQSSLIHFT